MSTTAMSDSTSVQQHTEEGTEACDKYEEVLVYVDFPDFDACNLLDETTAVELVGICGEEPRCKIGELNFSGQHEINLGTQLFVESDTGKCVGHSVNVVNFRLRTIDTEGANERQS
jgi:hypothetical protein